jgi:hypothetical protein
MTRRFAALSGVAFSLACTSSPQRGAAERPPIGIGVRDSVGAWCAEFTNDSMPMPMEGASATLVFVGDSSNLTALVRIRARRTSDCSTAFAQPRWTSYTAFDVELAEPGSDRDSLPHLALIVGGSTRLARGDRGIVRGDIDGDGTPEEITRCAADEGEHFTVWSVPRSGPRIRRWHEYFDWGAIVDPTCKPGEDGREPPK